jgi:hypothetical protein
MDKAEEADEEKTAANRDFEACFDVFKTDIIALSTKIVEEFHFYQ